MTTWKTLLLAVFGVLPVIADEMPTDIWAGLRTHPAVVNPVSTEVFGQSEDVLSLSGEWDFLTAPHGNGHGLERLFKTDLWARKEARKINVPGVWEAQGVGEEGMTTPYLCQDNSPKVVRHVFNGCGWYRKYVTLPERWHGKRIWLKSGGVGSQARFYVNDHAVAWLDAGNGAWKWDITPFVRFDGPNRIAAEVDNVVARRGGPTAEMNRWGGLWRDVEIEATPAEVWIDDAWVRGLFDEKAAEVHVAVGGSRSCATADAQERVPPDATGTTGVSPDVAVSSKPPYQIRVTIDSRSSTQTLKQSNTQTIAVPLAELRPWSPEHPNLYWAKIELLKDGMVLQTRHERFGVRKLEARGRALYLNGRPFFVRGFGDNAEYPITGHTPADRDCHRAHLEVARLSGFNYVRLHTHAEAPEFFEAADEKGIIVAPEIPYYLDNPNDTFSYDPKRDADDLITAFRRYPSFAVFSFGNEGMLGPAANRILYEHVKRRCPGLCVIAQDGGTYLCDDGAGCSDLCSGPLTTWARGTFDPPKPFICHEYLNLAAKFDWRNAAEYTGVWLPPMTLRDRRAHLAHTGLSDAWLERLQDASHDLQRHWQKYGIEMARADPHCDGYIYWTITDSSVFSDQTGTFVGQGLYDPFWKTKRHGAGPSDFAVFNSDTCLMLDTETAPRDMTPDTNTLLLCSASCPALEATNRVLAAGETIAARFLMSHFGETPFHSPTLKWSLCADGTTLASGSKALSHDVACGLQGEVAALKIAVPGVGRPVAAKLFASVSDAAGHSVSNDWPFWVFPQIADSAEPTNVTVAAYGSPEVDAVRERGGNLLILSRQTGKANYTMGWWNVGAQAGMAVIPHPALGDFPAGDFLSPLYFRIVKEADKLPVPGYSECDYVIVGEGRRDAYLYLAAKEREDGSREVFVSGLDITSPTIEGRSLRRNLLQWLSDGRRRESRGVAKNLSTTALDCPDGPVADTVPPKPQATAAESAALEDFYRTPEARRRADMSCVVFRRGKVAGRESYAVDAPRGAQGPITVTSEDDDGERRARHYVEDRLLAGDLASCTRKPWLRNRIARCFFGPINRPPLNRDELLDDVDYYPDALLEQLERDGVNGLWLTVEFRKLASTRFLPRDADAERRLAKLNRTIAKCAKYGIRIWLFSIEPLEVDFRKDPLALAHPNWIGCTYDDLMGTLCASEPEVGEYIESSVQDIFSRAPGLGGLINISKGERTTSCLSLYGNPKWWTCPRCRWKSQSELHHLVTGAMIRGMRRANPNAELISWLYLGGDSYDRPWIAESAATTPDGVTQMNNFETGLNIFQEGRWRKGDDYWLSQSGPADQFRRTAAAARKAGRTLAAKIQTSCSHELATIPVLPVPGLLYRKFRGMRECGVDQAMLCWYFGSAPGIMMKAAGELAFSDFSEDEQTFVTRLLRPDWGDDAPAVARLCAAYADAYSQYPLSNDFQYYGPYHEGVVWPLRPDIEMRPLGDSYEPMQPAAGDLVGECLKDFDLVEVAAIAARMLQGTDCRDASGRDVLDVLSEKYNGNQARQRDLGLFRALRCHFTSASDVLNFYLDRSVAVAESRFRGNFEAARKAVARMRGIVSREQEVTSEMKRLSQRDVRLGYHSEAEVHKYFPAVFDWRQTTLEIAARRLAEIDAALAAGKAYPESELERVAPVVDGVIDEDGYLVVSGRLPGEGDITAWVYDMCGTTRSKPYVVKAESDDSFVVRIPPTDWQCDDRRRPGWVQFHRGCHWTGDNARWPVHPPVPYRWGHGDLQGYFSARISIPGTQRRH